MSRDPTGAARHWRHPPGARVCCEPEVTSPARDRKRREEAKGAGGGGGGGAGAAPVSPGPFLCPFLFSSPFPVLCPLPEPPPQLAGPPSCCPGLHCPIYMNVYIHIYMYIHVCVCIFIFMYYMSVGAAVGASSGIEASSPAPGAALEPRQKGIARK